MSDCLKAALSYAAVGWGVLPCSPEHKRPLLAAEKDGGGKAIRGTGGLSKATTDAAQIRDWWAKWPKAMVAVATGTGVAASADATAAGWGGARAFVLDFDPRIDDVTGEEIGLEQLKAELVAQMGCDLPRSLTAMTQSGGVHVWLRWPDDGGAPIRNRGNLPAHVDVRGEGGYVIMPPSVMATGARYRWLAGRAPGDIAIAEAPAALIRILRERGGAAAASPAPARVVTGVRPSPNPSPSGEGDKVDVARRRYALAALDAEIGRVAGAGSGQRNAQLNASAFAVAQLVAAGVLGAAMARAGIEAAAKGNPGRDDDAQIMATIDSGWAAGMAEPKDMSDIGVRGNSSASRGGRRPEGPSATPRPNTGGAGASAAAGSPRPDDAGGPAPRGDDRTLPQRKHGSGSTPARAADDISDAQRLQLGRIGADWLTRQAVPTGKDGARSLAWRAGRRFAGGLLGPMACWLMLHGLTGIDGATAAELGEQFDAGVVRGFDVGPLLIDLGNAVLPMTDMGNAERFIARFGDAFRFTTAKGWMGWDGRRWAVLDQEQDTTPAEVMAAVFATVRAIQDEARVVSASGWRGDDGLEYVWRATKTTMILFSEALGAHGRASESAGRLGCIANLAKRWMTVSIEAFDTDPFAINCKNGVVMIERGRDGAPPRAVLVDHDRQRLISKLAPVDYDPDAPAPLYDALIDFAQPVAAMRRYLHQWGGYSVSGHIGEQILHFWYGRGANGKSTVIDAWAGAAGDYAGTVQIETFLDQGIKKRGDAATPDLARLGGVRLLRASEPERGAKLNEALIKAATGGEPMAVRALHRGFFDLRPAFKLTMGGNYRPDVPGTDEGIWRRLKLMPWDSYLPPEARDRDLPEKLKGEFPGIFARLVNGLLDWMAHGFVEPDAVIEATAEYRNDSDPLARFLSMCVEVDANARVQSSVLHNVFCAWAKAAGETEWTNKGLTKAMKAKGYSSKASNGMQWLGIRLTRGVGDFIDEHGKVIDLARLDGGGVTGGAVAGSSAGGMDDGPADLGDPPSWQWSSGDDPFGGP